MEVSQPYKRKKKEIEQSVQLLNSVLPHGTWHVCAHVIIHGKKQFAHGVTAYVEAQKRTVEIRIPIDKSAYLSMADRIMIGNLRFVIVDGTINMVEDEV